MWRVLIAIGLMVSSSAVAEARGLRFSFRPRLITISRPLARRLEKTSPSTALLPRKDRETGPTLPSASILDVPRPPVAPVTAAARAPVLDPAVHWCDNGKVVGSGSGFCVLNAGSDTPS